MDTDQNTADQIITISKKDPKFTEKCVSLGDCIKVGKYTITQLVQDLGPLLTSTSVDEREKGTLILSLVISYMPEDILNTTQLNYLCNFYSERLNDHHQVVPAVIKGLTPLIISKNMPDGLSTQLLNSLFQHVPCQQQQQSDRYNIYIFIKTLLDKRKEEMKAMGLDLVYGVISAIDSERDPRNLLFLFNWLPHFLKMIELGQLTEEMFEVMSCYFPVDFKAPSQDENNITRENLAQALCPCLCAIPSFAELCILLALEKLESELNIAKLDSLDLLIEGCKNFPDDIYKRHSTAIWSLIQKEVFNCKDKQNKGLEEKCLLTLTLFLRKISSDKEFSKQIVKDIIDTLKGNLRPDAILFEPSSILLRCISKASSATAELVFKETSALLINMYNITMTPSHKAIILQELVNIAVTYLFSNSEISIDDNENLKLIPNICLKAVIDTDSEVRCTGICSFSYLAKYIPQTVRNYFYCNLSTLLVLKQEPIVREALISSLKIFAELYHQEIKQILETVQTNGLESLKLYLEALGSVVSIKELMPFSLSTLVRYALKTFDISVVTMEILRNKLEENELTIYKYLIKEEKIVEKLVDYFIENLDNFNAELHSNFLNNIVKILNTVIRNLEKDNQEAIMKKQLEKIQVLQKANDITVVILLGLLSSLKPNVKIDANIINQIFDITFATKSQYICNIGSQLLANIINKCGEEVSLGNYLNYVELKCNELLLMDQQIENVIEIITFVTKALVIQSSPRMIAWIEKLIHLSAINLNVARAFQVMLNDNFDYLSAKSYCNRKLLYKQKFFSTMTTYMVNDYDENKKYYLAILGYLLQNVPQQILQLELKKIIRLIMLCLSYCRETEVLHAVLSAINTIIENKDEVAEDYIQELLKYYSKLTIFDKSMKIRILALKGIRLYSEYPLYKLIPLKQDMLIVLGKCLDDKKRLVRKEAVETRSKWFLIDAPM